MYGFYLLIRKREKDMTQPISGLGLVQQNSGRYNKSQPFAAMKKECSIVTTSQNDNGYFCNIIDTEKKVSHLLKDTNNDGVFDHYRKTEYLENGDRLAYQDDDFDGTYDKVFYFHPTQDGSEITSVDDNIDGEMDRYLY